MLIKICATNFLSWKTLEFDLDNGVTLIDGWNDDDQTSEGSGKSAILNAVSWCIYGKIPKEANIDDVIKHGEKGCSVEVFFEDQHISRIVRSRKPNDLVVVDINEKEIKGKDARETQKIIEEFVGLSFDAFCQSIYFAQNNDKKFISSNQEDRGKILSEIQDLTLFDRSRKEVMSLLKIENDNLSKVKQEAQLETKNLELIENQIQYELNMINNKKQQREEQLKSMKDRIGILNTQRDNVISELKSLAPKVSQKIDFSKQKHDLESRNNELLQLVQQKSVSIRDADKIKAEKDRKMDEGKRTGHEYKRVLNKIKELEDFINSPEKKCPTCGSITENLNVDHSKDELEVQQGVLLLCEKNLAAIAKEMDNLVVPDVSSLRKEVRELESEISNNRNELQKLSMSEIEYSKIHATIEQVGKQKLQLDGDIQKLENEYSQLSESPLDIDRDNLSRAESKRVEIKEKIDSLRCVIDEKERYIQRLESLKSGFKEIKSYIFNSVLNEINVRVSKYIERLFTVPVTLKFVNDNMKISVEASINGNPQGLGLMSGGQFRRMALATDLALSDVVSSRKGNKFNVLIMDEYFKDLSEQSMDKCLDLLESRNQPVLLIEHNSIFKNVVDQSFFVKYSNGESFSQPGVQ